MTDPFVEALDAADADGSDFQRAIDEALLLSMTEDAFALSRGVDPGDVAGSM